MTKIIGITGGIGSGKSTLSNFLEKNGYPVHDSDKVVSMMYKKPKKNFLEFIKKNGLNEAIKKNKINKKIVANKIFNDKKLKKSFEKYIHKEVGLQRECFISKNIQIKKKTIFLDVPLLLENRLDKQFDIILCILSKKTNREQRILKKKKFSKEILGKIFKNQTTDKQRRARSNIIIYNNKTKKDFIYSAQKALMAFLKWEKL